MDRLNILILGDGLLGSELRIKTGWDILSRKIDSIDAKEFNKWCSKLSNYDIVVNCIANTDTYSSDSESHWEINYKFVYNLLNYCNLHKKKLVHISTDYLYTNSINNATENDIPVHINTWYGYTKLLSDGIVQLLCDNYLICRCTHKPKPFPYDKAWVDQIGNFDYVDEIARLIINLIKSNSTGVYNVGTETKTMFELASKTKEVKKDFSPINFPKNTSMNINKLLEKIKYDNN